MTLGKLMAACGALAVLSACGSTMTVTVDPHVLSISSARTKELLAAGTAYKAKDSNGSIKAGDYVALDHPVSAYDGNTHTTWVVAGLVPRAGAVAAEVAEQDAGSTQSFQRADGAATWTVTDIGSAGSCHAYGTEGFPPLALAKAWKWHIDPACANAG